MLCCVCLLSRFRFCLVLIDCSKKESVFMSHDYLTLKAVKVEVGWNGLGFLLFGREVLVYML